MLAKLKTVASWIHAVLLSLGILLAYVLLVEFVPDLWIEWRRSGYNPNMKDFRTEAEAYRDVPFTNEMFYELKWAESHLAWHPYTYWRTTAYHGKWVNVGDDGLRATTPAPAGDKPVVRLFVFGGSAVWGYGVEDAATLPSLFSERLNRDSACRVEVVNFGQLGYVSGQELASFTDQLRLGNIPDVALFHHGWNDIAAAHVSQKAGVPMNEVNRRREFNVLHRDNTFAWLAKGLPNVFHRTLKKIYRIIDYDPPVTIALTDDQRRQLGADSMAILGANQRTIAALGREWGVRTLAGVQPSLGTKHVHSPFEAKLAKLESDVGLLVDEANTHLKQSLPEGTVLDVMNALDDDPRPLYFDSVHLAEDGNRAVADAWMKHLAPVVAKACADKQRGTSDARPR